MNRYFLIAFFVHLCISLTAQKLYETTRLAGEIKLDGILDESIWAKVQVAQEFTTSYPGYGEISEFKTFARIVYDDDAVYIAAELHDPQPDSVNYSLSQRDDFGNADWFGILIDPYGKGVSGYSFTVTAAGVEVDALEYTDDSDYTWNSVWKSAVVKTEYGWSLEMRLPFSAIRFPNKPVQEWKFNFYRQVRRTREVSNWNPINPVVFGEITQCADLEGLENIESPVRLSFIPYATGYLENSYDEELDRQTWKRRLAGGMDLKYGINDAFTLDMTLIPDFGQTTSDKKVLNLGPFEVMYNENRPFFLEGTDLFSIGGVFYSRRIGGTPFNYGKYNLGEGEEVVSEPETSPLINASKISGRTKSGLGLGIFNALEGVTTATIIDSVGNKRFVETNPLTNYNVFVLSQNLNNNSSVSFVNTNVFRNGANRDANVSVGTATIFSKDRKYKVSGTVNVSLISEQEYTVGHAQSYSIDKVAGKLRYGLSYGEESDTYNPNDLGFLYANNSRNYYAYVSWNDFTPGNYFLRKWSTVSAYYEELYSPGYYTILNTNWSYAGTLRNFLTVGLNGSINPLGEVNHFESRTFGKEVNFNPNYSFGGFYSSDYSKTFALDMRFWVKDFINTDQYGYNFTISPRIRFSDRLFVVWNTSYDHYNNDYGYVYVLDDTFSDKIILGTRNRHIVENSLQSEFIFTNRMGIDLRVRHYWQQVDYQGFNQLLDEGRTIETDYNPLSDNGKSQHNTSYNAFTVDLNYRWVFIPGSELRIVYKNNLFHSKSELDGNYFGTFGSLFDQPQINSISMKFLVYVDVLYFRMKNRK